MAPWNQSKVVKIALNQRSTLRAQTFARQLISPHIVVRPQNNEVVCYAARLLFQG